MRTDILGVGFDNLTLEEAAQAAASSKVVGKPSAYRVGRQYTSACRNS